MLKENRGIRCSFTAYRPICLPSIVFSWKEIRERGSRSPVCRWICSPDATDRRQGTARNHKSWDRRGGSGATGLGTFSGARPAQRSATPPTIERGVRRGRAGWRPFRVTRRPVRQCRYHRRVPRSPSVSLVGLFGIGWSLGDFCDPDTVPPAPILESPAGFLARSG